VRSATKKYNTAYKKKIDVHRDTFLPRLSPKGVIQCSGCGAFYHRRRWTLSMPAGAPPPGRAERTYCPACRKIKERRPSGELCLVGAAVGDRGEILRLLRNEESRAREKNPLERIMRMDNAQNQWRIETTTEKLAQRLGRALHRTRGGKVEYRWSHNNKFARVVWTGPGEHRPSV
jgi:hypothetical protein